MVENTSLSKNTLVNIKNIIINNIGPLLLAQIITFTINFFQLIYLARILAPENFGIINYAQTILFYVFMFSNLGISFMGTRELALKHAFNPSLFWNITIFRLLLAGVSIVISYFWFISVHEDSTIGVILIIYLCTLLPTILTPDWVFNGLEMMRINSVIKILVAAIGFVLILVLIKSPENLILVPIASMISLIIGVVVGMLCLKKLDGGWNIQIQPSLWIGYIIKSFNLGITSNLVVLIGTIDIFVIGILLSGIEVGYYSAASKLILSFHTLLNLVVLGVFPIIARTMHSNPDLIKKISPHIITLILVLEIPLCMVISINSDFLIHLLYGMKYESTIPVLAVLIWSIIPYSLCSVYTTILSATYREAIIVKILALQLILLVPAIIAGTSIFGIQYTAGIVVIIGMIISLVYAVKYRNEIIIPMKNVLILSGFCVMILGMNAVLSTYNNHDSLEIVLRMGSIIVMVLGIIFFRILPTRQIISIIFDGK